MQSTPPLGGGDFSGKRYVWIKDPTVAFTKAEVIEDDEGMLTVRCEDGMVCIVETGSGNEGRISANKTYRRK